MKYCYAITKSDGSPTFGKRINDATVTLKINIRGDLYYRLHTQKRHKNFDYSTIMDRLKAVSWGNKSHPISVVKPVYGILTFLLTAKVVIQKDTHCKIFLVKKTEDQQPTKAERP